MKSLKYICATLFVGISVIACEEDAGFPATRTGITPVVTVNPDKEVFDVANRLTTAVEFTLAVNNFGGNLEAESIEIHVASGAAVNTALGFAAALPVKTVTTFPSTVSVSLAEVCTALGLDINTVANNRSFEFFFVLTATDGTVFREGLNVHPGVVSAISLGNYKYRFFATCKTGVEEGYYTATISGTNRLGIGSEKEVRIAKQTINLEGGSTYLNHMKDIFTITDLSAGFYPKSGVNPTLISNQPVGIREVCGTFSLFNNALLTLPSPNPQVTFTVTGGSWNATTKTLTITWTDATNTITETTTFVKVRDL